LPVAYPSILLIFILSDRFDLFTSYWADVTLACFWIVVIFVAETLSS